MEGQSPANRLMQRGLAEMAERVARRHSILIALAQADGQPWGSIAEATEHTAEMMYGKQADAVEQIIVAAVVRTKPMIPVTEVTEADFWAAMKPLYDLLGTTPMHVFDDPAGEGVALSISRDDDLQIHVRFKTVVEDRDAESPWPIGTTGDGETDELTYGVDVVVKTGPTDVIAELWPGSYAKGTPAHKSGV